jgi:hypothetical protein
MKYFDAKYRCEKCGDMPCTVIITYFFEGRDDPIMEPYKDGPDYRKQCVMGCCEADFKRVIP